MKLVLASIAVLAVASLVVGESINVSIHYRAFCPYSQAFITHQIPAALEVLGDEVLNIELVPQSLNTTDADGNLAPTCYNGENECVAEQYQSCVWVGNFTQIQKLAFLVCIESMGDPSREENIRQCVQFADIYWSDISDCYQNGEGYKYLIHFNEIQHSYDTEIIHVPFIIYNNVVDHDVSESAMYGFAKTTCGLLEEKPSGCPSNE